MLTCVPAACVSHAGLPRYEMFTCYLGKGDKETFAYAFMSVGEPYSLVRTPPRAIGTMGMCTGLGGCGLQRRVPCWC